MNRVIVTHFGNTEDWLDLEMQTNTVVELIKSRESFQPTILLGYLTTVPFSDRYIRIIESGLRDTLNSLDRYCEYILYKDIDPVSLIRVDKGNISGQS